MPHLLVAHERYPIALKADFCPRFWEFLMCEVTKIILYKLRFNPSEVRLNGVTKVILHSLIFSYLTKCKLSSLVGVSTSITWIVDFAHICRQIQIPSTL